MSEIITRPIGSYFKCNDVVLEVVENTLGSDGWCGGKDDCCYFARLCSFGCDKSDFENIGCCSTFSRSDGKDVYFREVKS